MLCSRLVSLSMNQFLTLLNFAGVSATKIRLATFAAQSLRLFFIVSLLSFSGAGAVMGGGNTNLLEKNGTLYLSDQEALKEARREAARAARAVAEMRVSQLPHSKTLGVGGTNRVDKVVGKTESDPALTVQPQSGEAVVSWAGILSPSGYEFEWGTAKEWTEKGGTMQQEVKLGPLEPKTEYHFRVRPAGSSEPWRKISFQTTECETPAAPDNLAAGSISTNGATISWRGEPGLIFVYQTKPGGNPVWVDGESDGTSLQTSIAISNLQPKTTYTTRVQSMGWCTNSEWKTVTFKTGP